MSDRAPLTAAEPLTAERLTEITARVERYEAALNATYPECEGDERPAQFRGELLAASEQLERWAYSDLRRLLAEVQRLRTEADERNALVVIAAQSLVTADEKDEDAPCSAMEHREEARDMLVKAWPDSEAEWKRLAKRGIIGPLRSETYLAKHRLCVELNELEQELARLRERLRWRTVSADGLPKAGASVLVWRWPDVSAPKVAYLHRNGQWALERGDHPVLPEDRWLSVPGENE